MMTFAVSESLSECAQSLDRLRLGKQRVEAYQIWRCLKGIKSGWRNHPAVLMWKGHECALAMYTNAMIDEWKFRGYRNNMEYLPHCKSPEFPWWWGWPPVRLSHQASLNRKDSEYYHFPRTKYSDYGYVWPSKVRPGLELYEWPKPELVCEPKN